MPNNAKILPIRDNKRLIHMSEAKSVPELAIEAQKLVKEYIRDVAFVDLLGDLKRMVNPLDYYQGLDVLQYAVMALMNDNIEEHGSVEDDSAINQVVTAIGYSSREKSLMLLANAAGIEKHDEAFHILDGLTTPDDELADADRKKDLAVLIKALQKTHDSL